MQDKVQPPPKPLVQALEDSRQWLESKGTNGSKICLAFEAWPHLDLRDAVLVEAMLQELDLSGSCLDRVVAMEATANGIRFDHASLVESDWGRAQMEGSSLIQAQAKDARFGRASLIDASLRECNLRGATLRRAVCIDADFTDAILIQADLSDALCSNTNFAGADLTGCRLDGCRLDSGTRFDGAKGLASACVSHLFFEDRGRLAGDEARALLQQLCEQAKK